MIDLNEGPRAVRSLPVEFWFSRPRRRRAVVGPLLKIAGWMALATAVGVVVVNGR
jgi:hypothetical protein